MERNMQIRDIIQKNQGYNGNNLNVPKSLKAAAQKLYREYNAKEEALFKQDRDSASAV